MPNLSTIVLKDNANADHSFVPRDITNGVATTVETAGVPIGEKLLSYSVAKTSAGRRKVQVKLAIPVVQDSVISGITKPVVVRVAYADLTFSFADTSATGERSDIRAYVESLMGNTQFIDACDNLSAPY